MADDCIKKNTKMTVIIKYGGRSAPLGGTITNRFQMLPYGRHRRAHTEN